MSEQIPEDFVDIVACLRADGAEFLVVGAHALALHGSPRATGDLEQLTVFASPISPLPGRCIRSAFPRFASISSRRSPE